MFLICVLTDILMDLQQVREAGFPFMEAALIFAQLTMSGLLCDPIL